MTRRETATGLLFISEFHVAAVVPTRGTEGVVGVLFHLNSGPLIYILRAEPNYGGGTEQSVAR